MSNDLNQCSFIGRLGKDPETRYTTLGEAVSSFSIAVGSSWKDKAGAKQERTEWVNITAWGKLAEICAEYLKKGQQVYIQGRIKTEKYTDKSGVDKYATKIVAETMQMLGGKSDKTEPEQQEHPAQSAQPVKQEPPKNFDNFDDDIPF